MDRPLDNQRHEHFAQLVASGTPAARAYVEVGYSARGANGNAARLTANDIVASRIRFLSSQHADKIARERDIDVDWVLQQYLEIVWADPSDLVEIVVSACRHCHGADHAWQWRDDDEYRAAMGAWNAAGVGMRRQVAKPTDAGGVGWSRSLAPHPDCPRCDGFGEAHVLTRPSRSHPLFAGVRTTRHGQQILLQDKMKALEGIGRILGAFKDDKNVQTDSDRLIKQIRDLAHAHGRGAVFASDQ